MSHIFPTHVLDLLHGDLCLVWTSVILMEDNSFPVEQSGSFDGECRLESVQLLTIDLSIDCLVVLQKFEIDDALDVPPDTTSLSWGEVHTWRSV